MNEHLLSAAKRWRASRLQRLGYSQRGAELVEFAIVLPIVLGLIWFTFEAFQIVSVRTAMRTSASQMAQYITAYGVPPENLGASATVPDLCAGLQDILDSSFANVRGNLGDAVDAEVLFWVINDPNLSTWEGNITQVDCQTLAERLQCNQQFGVELHAAVPWRSVIFGIGDTVTTDWTLDMTEIAMGTSPCEPYLLLRDAAAFRVSEGPGGCVVEVHWTVEGSFMPEKYEIYEDSDSPENLIKIIEDPTATSAQVNIAAGEATSLIIKAVSFAREETLTTAPVSCMMPLPTPEGE